MDPLEFLSDLRLACTDAVNDSRQIARAMATIKTIEVHYGISEANFIAILYAKISQRVIGKTNDPASAIGIELSYPKTIIRGEPQTNCYVDMAFNELGFWLTRSNRKFALVEVRPIWDKLDGITKDEILWDAEKLQAIKEQHEPNAALAIIIPNIGRNEIDTSSLDIFKEKLDEVIIC